MDDITDLLDMSLLKLMSSRSVMSSNHLRPTGHEFEQTPGDGVGQGSLVCCNPRGRKESDTTKRLNDNNSAYKLNKQGDHIQPCHTTFPILMFCVWF